MTPTSCSVTVMVMFISSLGFGNWPVFEDITQQANLDFKHGFGDPKMSCILEATGPGCAFLDYDQDGWLDIYVVNGRFVEGISDPAAAPKEDKGSAPTNHLFRNLGHGRFEDVTQKAGVGDLSYSIGVVVADYDNNGYPDIYVCNYGPNVLYHNLGNGHFEDRTKQAGLSGHATISGFQKWSLHGCFLDYDRDGWLDLFVCNYLAFDPDYEYYFGPEGFPGPLAYEGQGDLLFRNRGDGTFVDVTKQAGLHDGGRGMSAGASDYDNDGDLDLFVANDAMENFLYQQIAPGKFQECALMSGVAFGAFGEATSSMAPIFEDLDGDGAMDLLVPDMGYSCLYRNEGEVFSDRTATSGIATACGQYTSWAPVVFDADNDGLKDVFITNGDPHHLYPEEDLLLKNKGNMKFEDMSLKSGQYFTKAEYVGRGAVFGDVDNDGQLDIFIANAGGPAVLLRNMGGKGNSWLTIRTQGEKSNRDGVGALVEVTVDGKKQFSEVKSGSGYLSSSDMRVHFGLGQAKEVEAIKIKWPSGITQTLKSVKPNQILTIKEDTTPQKP